MPIPFHGNFGTLTLVSGVCGLNVQWTFLLLCVASIWVHNSLLSAYLLMAGVATSRLGLWMFDLAVIQQMQVSRTRYLVINLLLGFL